MPTRGFMQCESQQFTDRTEIEIEILGKDAKLRGDIDDRLLQLHQRPAHLLGLFIGQRTGFHAADRLALEESSDEFDERQYELRDRALDVVRIRVPAKRRRSAAGPFELTPQVVEP